MADYLLTNDQLLPALEPMFTRFREAGGDSTTSDDPDATFLPIACNR
ncbi:MAG TPA: hypothetical protein VH395_15630 [Jatrophihabitantaceae bacterium]|jgi:hypothetical protein